MITYNFIQFIESMNKEELTLYYKQLSNELKAREKDNLFLKSMKHRESNFNRIDEIKFIMDIIKTLKGGDLK